jgi:hypothetical protein
MIFGRLLASDVVLACALLLTDTAVQDEQLKAKVKITLTTTNIFIISPNQTDNLYSKFF